MAWEGTNILVNICTKPNRTIRFLKQNLLVCSQVVKELAYKSGAFSPRVCKLSLGPLKYYSSGWSGERTESCRKVCYWKLLSWNWEYDWHSRTTVRESLKQSRLILLYAGLKGKAIMPTHDCVKPDRLSWNMAFKHSIGGLTFTGSVSSQVLLWIGMNSLLLFYPLLKVLRIASLDLPT